MLKIENVEVLGWEHAIRGMRNPKNSWDRSDSHYNLYCDDILCTDCPAIHHNLTDCEECLNNHFGNTNIGPNDHALMESLATGGPVHAKYRRMITVYLDITAPLYWWKEFDTYKVGTVANSCSTMHKIHSKEFTLEDFSTDHLIDTEDPEFAEIVEMNEALSPMEDLIYDIVKLNTYRDLYLKNKGNEKLQKKWWWQMIQRLPTNYNQKRTVMLNYEVLANIYQWRRNHKLDEWHVVCDWIESLPYSELITGKKE